MANRELLAIERIAMALEKLADAVEAISFEPHLTPQSKLNPRPVKPKAQYVE